MYSFRNFTYVSSYLHLKQNFKTINVTKLTKVILESSYRVLQVTFKWKTLKQPTYFSKAVEFWSTFDFQIDIITLAIFWENLQNPILYTDNCPLEILPRTITPRLLLHGHLPLNNFPLHNCSPWTIAPPRKLPPGQLPLNYSHPQDNYPSTVTPK